MKIFNCNFDAGTVLTSQCGGSVSQFNSGTMPTVTILANEGLTINGLISSITDVRSISIMKLRMKRRILLNKK